MQRTACLILFPRFSEYELSVALSILAQGGVNTRVVALSSEPVRGEAGLTVLPEGDLGDAPREGIDAVIVPGADGFGHLVDEVELYEYLRGVVVASPTAVIAGISAGNFHYRQSGTPGRISLCHAIFRRDSAITPGCEAWASPAESHGVDKFSRGPLIWNAR